MSVTHLRARHVIPSPSTPANEPVVAPPDAEVLLIPSQVSSVLPPHVSPRGVAGGMVAFDAATAKGPTDATDVTPAGPLSSQLTAALVDGETCLADAILSLVWRQSGLVAAHEMLASCLADAGRDWYEEPLELLSVKAMTATARAVLERMRAATPAATRAGVVVLAVPPGDPHTLALSALAHQVEQAGRSALIVDDLPLVELAALAAWPSTVAVVISAHLPWRTGQSNRVVTALRASHQDLLVVLGGPGAPRRGRPLGLVTDDVPAMLEAMEGRDAVLTLREREVMTAVADGLTNLEIADQLGVSPSTVKTHLDRVFVKTGTVHRAAAVAHALRRGWIA